MVHAIVKKIMLKGIKKYALVYNAPEENVQIKVTNDVNGHVFYTICVDFRDKEVVTFLQIMDSKIDLLGYQQISNPYMKKSLELYAKDTNDEIENVCSFIVKVQNNIGIAFYNKYKNGKSVSLEEHLIELGL